MIIPQQQLSAEALQGLIEEFITREGTDYGWQEMSLSSKVAQLRKQLDLGEIVIVFDVATESVSLLSRREAALLAQSEPTRMQTEHYTEHYVDSEPFTPDE